MRHLLRSPLSGAPAALARRTPRFISALLLARCPVTAPGAPRHRADGDKRALETSRERGRAGLPPGWAPPGRHFQGFMESTWQGARHGQSPGVPRCPGRSLPPPTPLCCRPGVPGQLLGQLMEGGCPGTLRG